MEAIYEIKHIRFKGIDVISEPNSKKRYRQCIGNFVDTFCLHSGRITCEPWDGFGLGINLEYHHAEEESALLFFYTDTEDRLCGFTLEIDQIDTVECCENDSVRSFGITMKSGAFFILDVDK